MKNVIKAGLLAGLMALAVGTIQAQTEIVVRHRLTRPHTVVVKRTPSPGRGHVWVEEDWAPSGTTYEFRGGRWEAPPREGAVYVKGHWRSTSGGYVWVPGHWR